MLNKLANCTSSIYLLEFKYEHDPGIPNSTTETFLMQLEK